MYYIPKSFYIAIFIGETLHFRPITTDKHGASSERALLSIIEYLMHYLNSITRINHQKPITDLESVSKKKIQI